MMRGKRLPKTPRRPLKSGLVIMRAEGEGLQIDVPGPSPDHPGTPIIITVVEQRGDRTKLHIHAPREYLVRRDELLDRPWTKGPDQENQKPAA